MTSRRTIPEREAMERLLSSRGFRDGLRTVVSRTHRGLREHSFSAYHEYGRLNFGPIAEGVPGKTMDILNSRKNVREGRTGEGSELATIDIHSHDYREDEEHTPVGPSEEDLIAHHLQVHMNAGFFADVIAHVKRGHPDVHLLFMSGRRILAKGAKAALAGRKSPEVAIRGIVSNAFHGVDLDGAETQQEVSERLAKIGVRSVHVVIPRSGARLTPEIVRRVIDGLFPEKGI